MKILLCHNYYQQPGGESQVFENQVKGLRQMGEAVVVYSRENSAIEQMSALDMAAIVFNAFSSQQTRKELNALAIREKPNVAIVQNVFPLMSPSIYQALSDAEVPIVQAVYNYRFICPSAELYTEGAICERCVAGNTAHAVVHRCYRQSYAQSAWYASILWYHRLMGTFSQKIDSFMVPDDFLGLKLVQGGIPAEKIWKNPNPFFVKEYQKTSSHDGYVLFVGRLVPQKGILTLLRAMENVGDPCKLLIVGQGELTHSIQEMLHNSHLGKRVELLGPRWGEDLKKLMKGCAAVAIPSEWYDNLPLILCQANAMGKPVIASRINGIPEYVDEGRNGFLFDVGDDIELARLIEKILYLSPEEYTRISISSRTYAEEVLDYPNHYRRLMEVIGKLVRKERYQGALRGSDHGT